MKLFPAIDLRSGRVVRLTQGDYDRMTVYGADGAAQADAFRRAGAKHLHLVDLDGAKDGAPANFEAIRAIARQGGLFVEVGGGIRTEAQIDAYLSLGAGRCILGSVAAMIFFAWQRKKSFWTIADFVSPLVAPGLMAGRIGYESLFTAILSMEACSLSISSRFIH